MYVLLACKVPACIGVYFIIPAEEETVSMSCSIQGAKQSCTSFGHNEAESGAGQMLWVGLEERGFTTLSVDACAHGQV
jgi:hypothetical protein